MAHPTPTSSPTGWLTRPRWNPYLVGAGIGGLSILAFGLANTPIGMSTQLAAAAGGVCDLAGMDVSQNAYFSNTPLKWDYGIVFLLASAVGAFISSITSRSFKPELVPAVWRERFGTAVLPRALAAFFGGAILLYGARLAGGCTSGHGISGSLQLALSSWTFFIVMFVAGVAAAGVMFGFGGRKA